MENNEKAAKMQNPERRNGVGGTVVCRVNLRYVEDKELCVGKSAENGWQVDEAMKHDCRKGGVRLGGVVGSE